MGYSIKATRIKWQTTNLLKREFVRPPHADCTIDTTPRPCVTPFANSAQRLSAFRMRNALPKVQAMLDKLAKQNIIHKNKASNIKSGLMIHVRKLA